MNKFGGTISLGGPKPSGEFDALVGAYKACGFDTSHIVTQGSFIHGLAEPFFPGQFGPVQAIQGINNATRQYFGNEVRPTVKKLLREEDSRAYSLARAVGKFVAFSARSGLMNLGEPAMEITANTVELHGRSIPVNLGDTYKYVVDYGMGVIGLITHIKNLRSGLYNAIAVQKEAGEAIALSGIADHYGLPRGRFVPLFGGITNGINNLAGSGWQNTASLVIASRVHEAGVDLRNGIKRAPELLAQGGVLLARGPRRYTEGIGYDEVGNLIRRHPSLRVMVDTEFARARASDGFQEPNRLIAAVKIYS